MGIPCDNVKVIFICEKCEPISSQLLHYWAEGQVTWEADLKASP